jgi:choline kinase
LAESGLQAVILAAGLGSRLGAMTTSLPKALIEVAGRPLIDYALRFAQACGAVRRVVVTGFHAGELRARVAAVDPQASCADNPDFRKGNLLSLRAGLPLAEPGRPLLVMNTDHIYRPAIAALVAGVAVAAAEVTAFCDRDRTLGADDMKVALDGRGRVARMSKQLDAWDVGYVGMTLIPAARRAAHVAAADAALAAQGEAIHVESVLVELAARGTPPEIADISGHGWLEVDEPHERERAERTLAAERWWG